jgi:methylmalonyl-CoA carboxyltransferase 5S subunit
MFPQVAPKFFKTRHEGRKNLGKDHTSPTAAEPKAQAGTAESVKSLAATVNYVITLNGKEHRVTVAPER